MAGVVEQADRLAGMPHQQADLGVGLDDGAHVVVEGHAHAEIRHALGERGELAAIGRPFLGGRARGRCEIGPQMAPWRPREVSA